ncbi:hypothetical protein QBE52_07970 [Clostridiaceae bacterium 35-E11]
MSRVERKEIEKQNKTKSNTKSCTKYIALMVLIVLLISGIMVVDNTLRMRLMIEEPKVFSHRKISPKIHQLYLCGEKIYIDEEEIENKYAYVKDEIKTFINILQERKNQLVNKVK